MCSTAYCGVINLDLMEMMLIQNAQMQQWMMTQSLQNRNSSANRVNNFYYDTAGRPLPPIRRYAIQLNYKH